MILVQNWFEERVFAVNVRSRFWPPAGGGFRGRLSLPVLIPGASHCIRGRLGLALRGDFLIEPVGVSLRLTVAV